MLKQEAMNLKETLVQIRRHLHENPELSFAEEETTSYLKNHLEKKGISVQTFEDYEGLVASIGNKNAGRKLLLRADIDALPLMEQSGVPYASKAPGRMHACGHDAHMTMLLGAAELLKKHEEELGGEVVLLFQSGEESGHGALWYVEQGLLDDVDACFALHVQPSLPKGTFSLDKGVRTSSCTDFEITVKGTAAHGSTPHLGHDAIVAASSAILNSQTIVSRMNNALHPLVVTFGTVSAGKQFNIIADIVKITGTIRTFDIESFETVPKTLEKIFKETASIYGCSATMEIVTKEPMCSNDDEHLLSLARNAATSLWGEECLHSMPSMMGSEDFAFFMEKAPGILGYFGVGEENSYPLHSSHFFLDDGLLYKGAGLFAKLALDYLKKEG